MIEVAGAAHPVVGALVVVAVLALGAMAVAVTESVVTAHVAGSPLGSAWSRPWRRAALVLARPQPVTERPDTLLWVLAPAAYVGMAALGLTVLPLGTVWAVADVRTGIVVLGSAEVLAMVAVFLHGWAPNSPLPLVAGYRFVAAGLSFLLLSIFVLIAAALPAESMSFGRIVASQEDGAWNVLRQPLGLPLFLVVALAVSLHGPLDVADAGELAGGTTAEVSGPARLAWGFARRAMLTTYAVATAVVFLAGPAGPLLPGWAWLAVKSLAVVVVLVWIGQRTARVPVERFVRVAWTVLLPLSFLHLAIAGVVTLA
ncbi:complex I subunit 1 family protein [Salsipaludibacter albus]|uniref:complex I subunit 1 family protein n=1 Tax=Salsipaludibacter albus TaxID=2849650 RepID=UPI001EE3E21D|nr:complex I subunit 1 family protein [Salsipaludibacter albus]MBY5161388.1 NADH-quinone oxidoreductase subunit H [Salsipaludibacter albus]